MASQPSNQTGWQIYRRLLHYTFSKWQHLLLGSVALLAFSGLNALMVYLIGPFVDNTYVDKNFEDMMWIPFALLGIITLRGISNFVGVYLIGFVGAHVIKELRQEMFNHIQYFPAQFFDHKATGEILSKFSFESLYAII